VAKNTTSVASV